MKKLFPRIFSVSYVVIALLLIGPLAYADGMSQPNDRPQAVPSVEQLEAQFEFDLNTRQEPYGQPKATSYYDDMADHVEQTLLMGDMIDKCIH